MHPDVSTQPWYYYYAANWDKTFFSVIPNWTIQTVRIFLGLLMSEMVIEEIFVGPLDIYELAAYLTFWGMMATFVSLV